MFLSITITLLTKWKLWQLETHGKLLPMIDHVLVSGRLELKQQFKCISFVLLPD